MTTTLSTSGYLVGKCLVAMPALADSNFHRTVVYVCAHTAEGAMGLVVNRTIDQLSFDDILEQMGITPSVDTDQIRVHFGGPVEAARGFVLHTADYRDEGTLPVDSNISLTATAEVLKDIASGHGPRHSLMVLGYAGWGSGQLDTELKENAWLICQPDEDLLFGGDVGQKWTLAMARMGIDMSRLVDTPGHA
ncbi:MAG: YqgE/AlgH family protein [Caenispirillum bisanense]|nr:YqgE/AlgH family protein [Caenispirillum bisanense]MCA1975351.1 YqgE/AlgH family protein [Caenispirillum sp.]